MNHCIVRDRGRYDDSLSIGTEYQVPGFAATGWDASR